MSRIQVDVIYPVVEDWGLCTSCNTVMNGVGIQQAPQVEEYPPEWQEEYQRFSELIFSLSDRYGDDILIRIYDPRSLQGLWKALRHGVRRYPTFIINGKRKVSGWDQGHLEQELHTAGAQAKLAE